MQNILAFGWILAIVLCFDSYGQAPTRVALKDALKKATQIGSLTAPNSRPFHIRAVVSEAENPQSPYQGSIEEWWLSPTEWRREVKAKDGMHQTIVVTGGVKSERDESDYFPLWLRNFVTALFDPVPKVSTWTAEGVRLEQSQLPNA